MSKHISINGQSYSSTEEMPADVRRQYEAAIKLLSKNTGALADAPASDVSISTTNSAPTSHTFKTVTEIRSSRIVINGKEYARWEDVPAAARAAFRLAGVNPQTASGHVTPLNLAFPGMRVQDGPVKLNIWWRWFNYETIWLGLFCSAFDFFLIYSFRTPRNGRSAPLVLEVIFFTLFFILCVFMNYSALCGFFNTTTIQLDHSQLIVKRGPLPCGGNRRLSVKHIEQICWERTFVADTLLQGGLGRGYVFPSKFEMNTKWLTSLNARMADKSSIPLIGLRNSGVADFLVHTLEQKLRMLRGAAPA